ncbi:MAG TPA: ABC transporter permease [Acidothermales bacterium]
MQTETGTRRPDDLASLEAGLDALSLDTRTHVSIGTRLRRTVLPPVIAIAVVLLGWQLVAWSGLKPRYAVPWPIDVWNTFTAAWSDGVVQQAIWTSMSRGIIGFLAAIVVATPLGLLVARVRFVRSAIGPILSALQSLPSVAWVPVAILWFGLTDATMYFVILMGAVPSIASGLVSGLDQVPPLYLRVGQVLGATGLTSARHVLLPAAFPGYLAGLKQGWAFAWRSLMAAEIIAASPQLGVGFGQLLQRGRDLAAMDLVILTVILILVMGMIVDAVAFRPLERRMLRTRGLLSRP